MTFAQVKANSTYDYLMAKYDSATLTPAQFAAETHRHPSHIRTMLQRGELPGSRVGARWVIPIAKAAAILEGGEANGE